MKATVILSTGDSRIKAETRERCESAIRFDEDRNAPRIFDIPENQDGKCENCNREIPRAAFRAKPEWKGRAAFRERGNRGFHDL